jgi:hypothetical protein
MAKNQKKRQSNIPTNHWKTNKLEQVVRLFRSGRAESEVSDILLNDNIAPTTILDLIQQAKASISKDFTKDRDYIVGQHVKRYDRDIQRLLHYMPRTADPQKGIEQKSNAYLRMIDTMGQKEKLLGYHAKNFNIKINNETIVTVKEKKKKWNLENLTLEEKIELLRLIGKSKRSDGEMYGIVLHGEEAKAKDAEFVQLKSADTGENIHEINVAHVDLKAIKAEPVTLLSAQEKLKQALLEQAKKAFKAAGSKDVTLKK